MNNSQRPLDLEVPILFLVYNRPNTTLRVFETIRNAKPKKLYVAADGPREDKEGEAEKCRQVRDIATAVDWDCKLITFFRERNLGCGFAVSEAITWFFDQETEGIILEDDCLPAPEFFPFCETLLERYRDDSRIMQIGGTNLVPEFQRNNEHSYFFSNHNNIWGWATWKRAWDLYDFEMRQYPSVMEKGFFDKHFSSIYEESYFKWVFERTYILPLVTWDYQWEFVRRTNSGLTISPAKNLVVNIGFGTDATHTVHPGDESSKLKLEKLPFPLEHPQYVMPDVKADTIGFILHYTTPLSRLKLFLKRFLPAPIRKMLFRSSINRYIHSYHAQSAKRLMGKGPEKAPITKTVHGVFVTPEYE